MHPTCARFLAEASTFVGKVREDPPGSNRCIITSEYGWTGGAPYCDMGVSVAARRAGVPEAVIPNSAYVPGRWADARRRDWVAKDPQPGDLVVMAFTGGKVPEHIGIVEHADRAHVWTIEFNTSPSGAGSQANGDGCWRKVRDRGVVIGFIHPPWAQAEGDDMLTEDDLNNIAKRVWTVGWPAPTKADPHRIEYAQDRLVAAARQVAVAGELAELRAALSTLTPGAVDVDALASAVVAHLGAGMARMLADELAKRLAG